MFDRTPPSAVTRSSLSLCAAASLIVASGCGSGGSGAEDLPFNVLLVTLDTTRADRLSCYGYERETTPHIDGLAREGARFERAVSTAGITPMSHSSILTGLNNYRHGMRVFYSPDVTHKLKESVDTLPEILGAEGWRTAAMVSSYPVSEVYGLDQGFDTFDTGLDLDGHDFTAQQKHETAWLDAPRCDDQRRGDATVSEALTWLDGTGEAPWCLWVHMFDVHDSSLVPPAEYTRHFGVEIDPEASLQDPQWRERMYDPELRFMDAQVGRLLDWIRDHGQWDRTIIVLTADHGQGLLDGLERHRWQKHRLLYDWCIRVPLLVRVPGEPPAVVDQQVRTIDVLPTILEALDLPAPDIEGASMLGLIRGQREAEPRLAYADALNLVDEHSPGKNLPPNCQDNLYCVTDGEWKMIWHEKEPRRSQLYDLVNDPGETRNVANKHPNRMKRFYGFLDERGAMHLEPPASGGVAPDARVLEQLGYGGGDDGESEESEPADEADGEGR